MSSIIHQRAPLWRDIYQSFSRMVGNQPTLRHFFEPISQWITGAHHAELSKCRLMSLDNACTDMVSLTLKVPKGWKGFKAGQHVLVTLQHNGRYVTRPFSISSSESLWKTHGNIQITCKVKQDGELTPLLASLSNQDTVFISAAQGQFIIAKTSDDVVLICAGSGVTPMRAYLQSLKDEGGTGANRQASIVLLYRFRGEQNGAFIEEMRALASSLPNFKLILSNSRIDEKMDWSLLPATTKQTSIYLCGPNGFMQQAKQALSEANVSPEQIHQEYFGPMTMNKDPSEQSGDAASLNVEANFVRDGMAYSITTNTDTNLLESAIDSGVEPPYGCRIGVCFQCVCNKVSGQIKDLRTGELSGTGKEQIQLCVSAPVTDITVEY